MDTVTLSAKLVRTAMRRLKMSPYDLARAAGLGEAALKAVLDGKPVSKSVASMLAAALSSSIEGLSTVAIRACSVCGKEFELPPQVGLYSTQDQVTCSEHVRGRSGSTPRIVDLEPDIVRRYQAGETMMEVATALNTSIDIIRGVLTRADVERRPRGRRVRVDVEAVVARYQERLPAGVTLAQVGEEFGLSGDQVSTLLERAGVQTRVKMLAVQRRARTPIPCGCGCGATLVPVDRAGKSTRRTFIEGHRRPTKESRFAGLTPEIARRYKAGETAQELATAFDVNFKTIYKVLKSAGVERRPPGTHSKATIIKRMETQSESLRKELTALESKLALAKEQIGASA